MSKLIVLAGAAMIAALGASTATAESTRAIIVEKVPVAHADLDLTTPEGAQAMLARLDRAADVVCGRKPLLSTSLDPLAQTRRAEYRKCKAGALDTATLGLGAPLVRAAHVSRGKPTAYAAKNR